MEFLKSGKQTQRSIAGTGQPVAVNSNQMQDSSAGQSVAWDSVIPVDLETHNEYNILSAESNSLRERGNTRLSMRMNRPPGDNMDNIDKHSLIWGLFVSSTMNAEVFS